MKLVKAMMDSILFFASDGRVNINIRGNGRPSSCSTSSCMSSIPAEESQSHYDEGDLEDICTTKLYHIVRAHFIRGMNHRQYITMCSGLIKNFKLCFGDGFTAQLQAEWVILFSCLLKKLIPVTIAYEMTNSSSDPFEGSVSINVLDSEEENYSVHNHSVNMSALYSVNEEGFMGGAAEACIVGASVREELAMPSGKYG